MLRLSTVKRVGSEWCRSDVALASRPAVLAASTPAVNVRGPGGPRDSRPGDQRYLPPQDAYIQPRRWKHQSAECGTSRRSCREQAWRLQQNSWRSEPSSCGKRPARGELWWPPRRSGSELATAVDEPPTSPQVRAERRRPREWRSRQWRWSNGSSENRCPQVIAQPANGGSAGLGSGVFAF